MRKIALIILTMFFLGACGNYKMGHKMSQKEIHQLDSIIETICDFPVRAFYCSAGICSLSRSSDGSIYLYLHKDGSLSSPNSTFPLLDRQKKKLAELYRRIIREKNGGVNTPNKRINI